jgi:hypothetical protein
VSLFGLYGPQNFVGSGSTFCWIVRNILISNSSSINAKESNSSSINAKESMIYIEGFHSFVLWKNSMYNFTFIWKYKKQWQFSAPGSIYHPILTFIL